MSDPAGRLGRDAVGPRRPGVAAGAFAWAGAVLFAGSLGYFLYSYLVRFGRPGPAGDTRSAVLFNVLLFSVFALHHSAMARAGAKAWLRRYVPAYVERSLYTWISSALFILVCAVWQPVPGIVYSLPPPLAFAGYAVQLAGIWLTTRAASALDGLDLAGVRPVLVARGGAVPRHVALETGGAYALVRHPVYLAWTLFVFGVPTMTATRAVFAAISTAYLAIAIPFEERSLVDVFGPDYLAYREKVRWRMLPGIY